MLVYERVEPEGRCVNPDGHAYVEAMTFGSRIPRVIVCPRCGQQWDILVWDDERADR